jgi:hypothetical protein
MCQLDHEALKTDERWPSLKFIGIQPDFTDDGEPAPLALANCACGSTLARPATAFEIAMAAYAQFCIGWARLGHYLRITKGS